MKKPVGPIIVCVAAAAFAGGALLFADDSSPSTAAPNSAVEASAHTTHEPYDAAAPDNDPPSADASTATIFIENFGFTTASVPTGATVTVVNRDSVPHTVTGPGFDTGVIDANGTATFVAPTEPGSYTFSCALHPSMVGTLAVA